MRLQWSIFVLAVLGTVSSATNQDSPLDLPLSPGPIVAQGITLSKALDEIGAMARHGYVLFGVEQRLRKHRPPKVNLNLRAGSTLRDALGQVARQLPDYKFRIVSRHLINVYPAGANHDPDNVLNTRVARLDLVVKPGSIFSHPQDFIPELNERLHPEAAGAQPSGRIGEVMEGTEQSVTLHLTDVTVREILNAVTEEWLKSAEGAQMPVGWLYSYDPDAAPPSEKHAWGFQFGLPDDWKKWRN